MKILHIDESFHTQYGYHTSPIAKEQVKQGHDVYVITVPADHLYPVFHDFGDDTPADEILRLDKIFEDKYGVHIIRCAIKGYISGRAIYTREIYRIIREINPDIIYSHNIDDYMSILLILKKIGYPLIFDSHMLEMASRNKLTKLYRLIYRNVVTKKLISNNYTVIRTQNDPYVTKCLGVPENQAPFISFGTDVQLFHPDNEVKQRVREQYNIHTNDFVVIYTGKLTEAKGGKLLAEVLKEKFTSSSYHDVIFVVVGNLTGAYGAEVDRLIKQSENRIICLPTMKYTELPALYQMSDLSIFPKQCSLSFYDAQACGLPVLSEDNNVNVERCSHGNGDNFKAGDEEDFRAKIQYFAEMPPDEFEKYRKQSIAYIQNGFSYHTVAKEYTDLMTQAINKFKKASE